LSMGRCRGRRSRTSRTRRCRCRCRWRGGLGAGSGERRTGRPPRSGRPRRGGSHRDHATRPVLRRWYARSRRWWPPGPPLLVVARRGEIAQDQLVYRPVDRVLRHRSRPPRAEHVTGPGGRSVGGGGDGVAQLSQGGTVRVGRFRRGRAGRPVRDCVVRGEWVGPSISNVGDPAMPNAAASGRADLPRGNRQVRGLPEPLEHRGEVRALGDVETSRFMIRHRLGTGRRPAAPPAPPRVNSCDPSGQAARADELGQGVVHPPQVRDPRLQVRPAAWASSRAASQPSGPPRSRCSSSSTSSRVKPSCWAR